MLPSESQTSLGVDQLYLPVKAALRLFPDLLVRLNQTAQLRSPRNWPPTAVATAAPAPDHRSPQTDGQAWRQRCSGRPRLFVFHVLRALPPQPASDSLPCCCGFSQAERGGAGREGVSQIKQELLDSDEKLGKLGASQTNALCRVAEIAC